MSNENRKQRAESGVREEKSIHNINHSSLITHHSSLSHHSSLFFYNLLLTALALPALPFAGLALLLRPRYRLGLTQRLGFLPAEVRQRVSGRELLWLHAPSVGELLATRPF